MPKEYKLLFIGGMGTGKTTAISAVSEIPPTLTDVVNNDRASFDKALTTVALDYGQVTLPSGDCLRLYGIPGQARFSFMWTALKQGCMGVILLVDASRKNPFAEFEMFVDAFSEIFSSGYAVVGIGRLAKNKELLIEYIKRLSKRNINVPVFAVDVREKDDVLLLLDALFTQIEVIEDCQIK